MEKNPVKRAEIVELMKLKGWSQTKLAAELHLSKSLITHWLAGERTPSGPATILLRQWLAEARKEPAAAG